MTEQGRNLTIRIVTSVLVVPVVTYLVYLGKWPFSALMGLAASICALEYYEITMGGWSPAAWVGVVVTALLPFTPLWSGGGFVAFSTLVGFGMFAWTYHLLRGQLKEGPAHVAYLCTGMVYGAGGLTALVGIRQLDLGGHWVMCVFFLTWLNDTFAYFVGRAFGRHKLYEAVSPKKSWEGFYGGAVGAALGLVAYKYILFHDLRFSDVLVMGALGGVMGPVGDLCESMLKRAHGVKDSGKIVPGHGGILDRIDALIFNAPLVFLYLTYGRPFFTNS